MSDKCNNIHCEYNSWRFCQVSNEAEECEAHKPYPNESPSSPRTSGSPTASRADSVEGTASQLAPVLRPAVGAASEDCVIGFAQPDESPSTAGYDDNNLMNLKSNP